MVRRIVPGLVLAAVLAALPGCTTWQGGVKGFLNSRAKDALEMGDFGVTVTRTPQFSFFLTGFSFAAGGYGRVDGTFTGLGGGDIGTMPVHYHHWGVVLVGQEETGWGDGLLWHYGNYDVNDRETKNIQGVGAISIVRDLATTGEGRPAGRPT